MLEVQLDRMRERLEASNRALLLEALTPVAAAMQRQGMQYSQFHQEQVSLLLEVLSSLQPSADQQISPLIGLSTQEQSSLSSAS